MTIGVLRPKRDSTELVGWTPGQVWVTPGHRHPLFMTDPPLSQNIHLRRVLTLAGLYKIVAGTGTP